MKPFEIIKKLRKSIRLNQTQVADVLKTGRANYTNKELGKTAFSADELLTLLTFFQKKVDKDLYLSALKILFGEEEIINQKIKPTPLDPAIEILNEVLKERGEELTPKIAQKYVGAIKAMIAAEDDEPNNVTPIVREHQNLIPQFKYKEKGLLANQSLLTIEKLNRKIFFKKVAELEELALDLTEKQDSDEIEKKIEEPKQQHNGKTAS